MQARRSITFSETELSLLEILWQKRSATVAEAVLALSKRIAPVRESVLAALRGLESKGFARQERRGGLEVFVPTHE